MGQWENQEQDMAVYRQFIQAVQAEQADGRLPLVNPNIRDLTAVDTLLPDWLVALSAHVWRRHGKDNYHVIMDTLFDELILPIVARQIAEHDMLELTVRLLKKELREISGKHQIH